MKKQLLSSLSKERTDEIRNIVIEWYENNCRQNEIESFDYDLSKPEERLKVIILGVFFNCIFNEKKALETFKEMEKYGYLRLETLDNFENNIKKVIKELKIKIGKSYGIVNIQRIIDSIESITELFSKEGDVDALYREIQDPEKFIKYLEIHLSGVKVKLLWICREFKTFWDIPEKYCYVPDSHVTKFLNNIGVISKKKSTYSLDDYIMISEVMSNLFSNPYFDLPFMRYHQQKCTDKIGCQCDINKCQFKNNMNY